MYSFSSAVRALGFLGFVFLTSCAVWAQPVPSREPASSHIFPAGGRRGTTVRVRLGTQCFPPLSRWSLDAEGAQVAAMLKDEAHPRYEPSARRDPTETPVEYCREWESAVEIAADAELGARLWRVTSARGGSGRRPFIIGDLPEFIETEPNSLPRHAERVDLPVTINGQIAGERDLDYYRFAVAAGQTVRCEVVSTRLGSPLEPLLEVRDDLGRRVDVVEQRIGCDPVVRFRAPRTGDYTLMISNLGYHGGPQYVYRATLAIEPGQHAVATATRSPADDTAAQATAVATPLDALGCFERPDDEDWLRFTLAKDDTVSILCEPQPAGAPTLPCLELFDELSDGAKQPVAQATCVGAAGQRAHIEWRAMKDGPVFLRVRDLQQLTRGGSEFGYRCQVRVGEQDFELSLPVDHANILPGGKLALDVSLLRHGGLKEPIELVVEGLPMGVTAERSQIAAGEGRGKVVLVATDDARPSAALVRVIGRATIAGEVVERAATAPHLGHDADGVSWGAAEVSDLHLTVEHKPVFRLFCQEAYQYGYRGSVHPYAMEIERLDGYDGPVTLQIGDRQNRDLDGIEMFETVIAQGKTQASMPIYLPEDMHVNVQSQSQLYVQGHAIFQDKWGEQQSLLVVSEKRNIIRTLPLVVKLRVVEREVVARPATTVPCRLVLDRTPNFSGPMQVELCPTAGFSAEPVTIVAGGTEAVVHVQTPADPPDQGAVLKFRARGELRPLVPLISEATLTVVFD